MILTHLVLFSFFDGAGSPSVPSTIPGTERGINGEVLNGLRTFGFLTGEINGPALQWDETPLLAVVIANWSIVGAVVVHLANATKAINSAAINAALSTLTGDISGPKLQWDETPPSVSPTTWNQP